VAEGAARAADVPVAGVIVFVRGAPLVDGRDGGGAHLDHDVVGRRLVLHCATWISDQSQLKG
jgi:hypothetical protein